MNDVELGNSGDLGQKRQEAREHAETQGAAGTRKLPSVTFPRTTDATVWAKEFFKRGYPEITEEIMLTWFANAIEEGKADVFQQLEDAKEGSKNA